MNKYTIVSDGTLKNTGVFDPDGKKLDLIEKIVIEPDSEKGVVTAWLKLSDIILDIENLEGDITINDPMIKAIENHRQDASEYYVGVVMVKKGGIIKNMALNVHPALFVDEYNTGCKNKEDEIRLINAIPISLEIFSVLAQGNTPDDHS